MIETGNLINISKEKIVVELPDFFCNKHNAQMNWLKMFNAENSLYEGGVNFKDKYPYDEGSAIWLFKIDTASGKITPLLNMLEENEIFD